MTTRESNANVSLRLDDGLYGVGDGSMSRSLSAIAATVKNVYGYYCTRYCVVAKQIFTAPAEYMRTAYGVAPIIRVL